MRRTDLFGGMSRRQFIAAAGLAGAGALSGSAARIVDRATRADPAGTGSVRDIEHVVLLMQENRSFDHYFGTMSGVRGFAEPGAPLAQPGYRPGVGVDAAGALLPYHLDTKRSARIDADILNDPAHSWSAQHEVYNHGAMNMWMTTHLRIDGVQHAPEVMGYYTRADIPTHYRLADAFTVCDHYFSSVLGPTAPNRLYWMSGTLGPAGASGAPLLTDAVKEPDGSLDWRTFPENLLDAGISWKVYNAHPLRVRSELSGMLRYFRAYQDPASELYRRGIAPRFPTDFERDVAAGTLPAVSWLIPQMRNSEHPSFPPASGAQGIMSVLDTLTANPGLWEKTALIVSYDENGGFFDHVAPPVPPTGADGEFIAGKGHAPEPIGLGFRVPCLVISPYSRGGNIFSGVSDHTSQLRFVGARFGVPVPNLTPWRRTAVGDLTGAVGAYRAGTVPLPDTTTRAAAREASVDLGQIKLAKAGRATPYPVPSNTTPHQDRTPHRRRIA